MLDTNIVVYSYDESEVEKRPIAQSLLRQLEGARSAALPAQVLAEFCNVAIRRLRPALRAADLRAEVERLSARFRVLPLTSHVVEEAVRGVGVYSFSYYDAQIWAATRLAGASVVLSEDFNTGATYEGVTFWNPFAPDTPPLPPA